ncbi:MAG: DUF3822 family protein [Bacteroidota bacterium]
MECILNQVDPRFEPMQGFKYRLSILLCPDRFSFLVTHASTCKLLKLSSYILDSTDIQKAETGGWPTIGDDYFGNLSTLDSGQLLCQRVDIAVVSSKITIAPPGYSKRSNMQKLMAAAFPYNADEEMLTEVLADNGPVSAVLVPRYVPEYCSSLFPGSFLRSAVALSLKGIMLRHSQFLPRQVFVNIYPQHFEMTVIQGSRLLYLNAFRYSSPSDVLYYVIFVMEQLGFELSEQEITLMGDVSQNSAIYGQLKMYCASLRFIEKPEGIDYGDAFEGIAMHNYFTLLNMPICE